MTRSVLLAGAASIVLACSGCGGLQRLSEIGSPPVMTPTADPTRDPNWRPITMPAQRAAQVGDIVTVVVNVVDSADVQNATVANRTGSQNVGVPGLFGLQSALSKALPKGTDLTQLLSTTSAGATQGTGTIKRNESVQLRVAGVVTQVLANGNLAVSGRQEMRVNSELRELLISGVIRPQDIASDNTVQHDRMAEARISYGGRGQLTDVQTARYGQQIVDLVSPF